MLRRGLHCSCYDLGLILDYVRTFLFFILYLFLNPHHLDILHKLMLTDFISIWQLFADVDIVSSFLLLLFGTSVWINQDYLLILEAQKRLLEVERSAFGAPVGDGEVRASRAQDSLGLLEHESDLFECTFAA